MGPEAALTLKPACDFVWLCKPPGLVAHCSAKSMRFGEQAWFGSWLCPSLEVTEQKGFTSQGLESAGNSVHLAGLREEGMNESMYVTRRDPELKATWNIALTYCRFGLL